MSLSTTDTLAGTPGGGVPSPAPARPVTITLTERDDHRVTVSTWTVCHGVGSLVGRLLLAHGAPESRTEVDRG